MTSALHQTHDHPGEALAQVLVVEDDPGLRENYALALERAGYTVRAVASAEQALECVSENLPDAAVLDIGLGRDPDAGFNLCRELRSRYARLPILFLTARDDEIDVISGLRLGADDYLSKNISLSELVARVQTVLRRVSTYAMQEDAVSSRRVGELELDGQRLLASWCGCRLELTVTEYQIVACLAERPGQVKSRAQLMSAAGVVLDDQTITAHVKRIRRKFEQHDKSFDAIATVYGLGYRWLDQS